MIGQCQLTRADRESLDDIGWLYDNIKIILCTIVYYEQLVTVTGSAIKDRIYVEFCIGTILTTISMKSSISFFCQLVYTCASSVSRT